MVQLTPEEKDYIRNELSDLLKKNDFAGVLSKCYRKNNIIAFLVENDIPLLKGLNNIPKQMFYQSKISRITIPGNIKRIGENAFNSAELNSVNIENGITAIEEGAFAQCKNLAYIELPDSLERIGPYAFYNSGLNQIVIPDGITYLEKEMFGDNENIKIYANSRKEMPSRFKLKCNSSDVEWFKQHLFLKGDAETEGEADE